MGGSYEEETADRCCGRTTNKHKDRWTSFAATTSWDEAHPGARASRPHNSWHSLGHLLHPARPATAPRPCFGRAHAVPAGRVAGCRIAGKLSGTQRDSMRAGRPRSRVAPPPIIFAPQGGTRRPAARADAAELSRLVVLRVPLWITLLSFVSDKPGPRPPRRGGSFESETIGNRSSLRDLGIPSRLTSTPSWPFVVLRGLLFFLCSFVSDKGPKFRLLIPFRR